MVSKFALLSNLLLASVVFAIPSSRLEERIALREGRQSQPVNRLENSKPQPAVAPSNVQYSSNWAGAVWDEPAGTFTSVTGTFTVPTPSGSNGAASAWVGIDGDTCQTAILQTGVDFMIRNGVPSYAAWYEWFPDYAYDFTGITINAGDVITTTVVASSTTSGTAYVINHTSGQSVSKALTSTYPLCEQNAEWIVEDFTQNNHLVPFANFSSVTFSNASASGAGSTVYSPTGATIIDIMQKNQVLTSVTTSGSSVTVQYI